MSRFRLLLQSLLFYWRTNLAVLLGVVAATAVIGGALIVGDSVRGSLRQMTLERLGEIDHAVSGYRFFREELAGEIGAREEFRAQFAAIAPAIAMKGALERSVETSNGATGTQRVVRAGQVNVYGADERLWELLEHGAVELPGDGEIVLNRRAADQLATEGPDGPRPVRPGDQVTVWIELPSSIPRDTLLGERQQTSTEMPLRVAAILDEEHGAGRLELNPNQQLPLTAFVSLETMQRNLGLERRRDRETRTIHPARVNALFVAAKPRANADAETAESAADQLTTLLRKGLQLADLRLRIVENEELGYVSLESEEQILPTAIRDATRRAAEELNLRASPVLVYLANEIANADPSKVDERNKAGYAMYSVVAGLPLPLEPPFGPLAFAGERPELPLSATEILINEWLAADLNVAPGDEIVLKFFEVGSHGELPEQERRFTVRGIVEMTGPGTDRTLTPNVEGITDARTFSDWERQPFPMDFERITPRDEEYWEEYRATPKAFLSLEAAQDLWRSRYGDLTSFRVEGSDADAFRSALLESLDLREVGLAFRPVKQEGLEAASGTTDFAGLFIGFSFFLILSATILIGLLFRLGIERRGAQVGLLSAVGFTSNQVRRQLLAEGTIVVVLGALAGIAAAIGYASLMVYGLRTWWVGAVGTRFLNVYVEPLSLLYGAVIAVAIALAAIWWGMRQLRKVSARELLAGAVQPALTAAEQRRRGRVAWLIGIGGTVAAAVLLITALTGLIPASEAFAGIAWPAVVFFVVGICLLAASLAFLAVWLDSDRSMAVRGSGLAGTGRLGLRNTARNRTRSVLTTGLIASATFVIVAVAAAHRDPTEEIPRKESGNGGFLLVAQTTTPILADFNSEEGRDRLNLFFDPNAASDEERRSASLVETMQVIPFRVMPGEDASCLNLYQTQLPTILGVPERMIERGGFKFVAAAVENPWTLLRGRDERDGVPVYPVLGDMNSLQYSLKKGVGDVIAVPDSETPDYLLEIAGMFDGSVFQGVLLMSEENFLRLYPERVGYEYFLIEAPPETGAELSNLLETRLADYGFDAEPVSQRLANFLAVQNTYLSTFQTLGGLGLLLGTIGLATVMLRNVLERRGELALLRAVGFRNARLAALVLCENALLLVWGLAAGTVSALLAMAPHLASTGTEIPWLGGGIILGAVFCVGMAAAWLAVSEAVRTPIVATLRAE